MRLVTRDLLHDVQIINGGEEVAEREFSDRLFWRGRGWIPQFVHLRAILAV